MKYWLLKEEPRKYSFEDLRQDRKTVWSGVRNYQARNNLRAMQPGDRVVYYHSGKEKAAVGVAVVLKEAFPDPTAAEGDWSSVEIKALEPLARAVSLAEARADEVLAATALVKQTRLSVMPLTAGQFRRFQALAKRKPQ